MKKSRHWAWFPSLVVVGLLAFQVVGALFFPLDAQVTAQYSVPGVHTLQVTIGATTTQVTAVDTPVKQVIFQDNAAGSMRVGDSATTSSRGALLAGGSPGGSMNFGPIPNTALNLSSFYVNGTNGQVLDVVYLQ